jgi:hypothetical protein
MHANLDYTVQPSQTRTGEGDRSIQRASAREGIANRIRTEKLERSRPLILGKQGRTACLVSRASRLTSPSITWEAK